MSEQGAEAKQKILVVDDYESVLDGIVNTLRQHLPDAEIVTARNAKEAEQQVARVQPDLAVLDLAMPEADGGLVKQETGIQLLRTLMQKYPTLNIVVHSAYPKALVRLKPIIQSHQGGFTIADKSMPLKEMMKRVNWALQGVVNTPREMRTGLEVRSEWLGLLKLAFEQGLQDKAIAEQMNVSERTVRNYWTQVQDALGVYPDEGKNIRVQTAVRAREEGLIE